MKKLILIGSLLASQCVYAEDILVDKRFPENAQINQSGKKLLKNKSFIEQSQYIHAQNKMTVNLSSFHKDEIVDPNDVVKAQQNLEDLQQSLYLQQLALKKKRQEYENAQSDFFQALNDKSKLLVKKEQEISGLGLELSVGIDKIENTKKELEQAINKYRSKYQDLAQFEKTLQDKEQHLAQLESNLANQDIILITKSEKVDSLVEEISAKSSIVEKQKEQLAEQSTEIQKLKKELARQQSVNHSQLTKKLSDIKNSESDNHTTKKTVAKTLTKKETKKPILTNKKLAPKAVDKIQKPEAFKNEKAQLNFKNQMSYSDKAAKPLDLNEILAPLNTKGSLVQNTINLFSSSKN